MKLSNTATRIIVALIFIPIIIALIYFGGYAYLGFIMLISAAGFIEFSRFTFNRDVFTDKYLGIITVQLIILNFYFKIVNDSLIITASAVILMLFELYRHRGTPLLNSGATFFGIIYMGYFAGSLVRIREVYGSDSLLYTEAGLIVLSMFISVWLCDSAAFFVGTAFGKHKMMPRVSPKKSWEGAIGGLVFALIGMVVMHQTFLDFVSLPEAMVVALIIGTFGQIGDLVESVLKRNAELKDSSGLIPGHGGVLDRFDSIFFSAPIIFIYLKYFVV